MSFGVSYRVLPQLRSCTPSCNVSPLSFRYITDHLVVLCLPASPRLVPTPYGPLTLPRELDSIPQDLRECLEQALAETPSQETLNVYLPDIRSIIFNLLNGLKQKQAHYKRITQERTDAATPTPPPPAQAQPLPAPQVGQVGSGGLGGASGASASVAEEMGPGSTNRTRAMMPESTSSERLSARSVGSTTSQGGGSERSTSPTPMPIPIPSTKIPSSSALAERNTQRSGLPSRPAPPDAFRPSRRAPEGPRRSVSPQPGATAAITEPPQPPRFQLQDPGPVRSPPKATTTTLTTPQISNPMSIPAPVPTVKPTPPRPDRYSRDSFGNRVSRFSADSDMTIGSPVKSPVAQTPPRGIPTLIEESPSQSQSISPNPNQSRTLAEALPPMLPTINIAPSISLQETALAPSPPIEAPVDVPPETRATLAALQRSDALERRASKRFSSYTFNKMLPSSPGKKQGSGTSPQRPVRRVDRAPPMPSLPEGLRRESESEGESISHLSPNAGTATLPPERAASPLSDGSSSSVRIVKTPPPDAGESTSQLQTPRQSGESSAAATQQSQLSNVAVFLQIGRQVKKATIDLPVTLSALRLLFMERFDYDPGMEDFPDVYVRDNRTGVHFELEDMEDLKEGAILSLSIERECSVAVRFRSNPIRSMRYNISSASAHGGADSRSPRPGQAAL